MMNFSVSLVNNWWFDESRIRAFDEWDEVALYLNMWIFFYICFYFIFLFEVNHLPINILASLVKLFLNNTFFFFFWMSRRHFRLMMSLHVSDISIMRKRAGCGRLGSSRYTLQWWESRRKGDRGYVCTPCIGNLKCTQGKLHRGCVYLCFTLKRDQLHIYSAAFWIFAEHRKLDQTRQRQVCVKGWQHD